MINHRQRPGHELLSDHPFIMLIIILMPQPQVTPPACNHLVHRLPAFLTQTSVEVVLDRWEANPRVLTDGRGQVELNSFCARETSCITAQYNVTILKTDDVYLMFHGVFLSPPHDVCEQPAYVLIGHVVPPAGLVEWPHTKEQQQTTQFWFNIQSK